MDRRNISNRSRCRSSVAGLKTRVTLRYSGTPETLLCDSTFRYACYTPLRPSLLSLRVEQLFRSSRPRPGSPAMCSRETVFKILNGLDAKGATAQIASGKGASSLLRHGLIQRQRVGVRWWEATITDTGHRTRRLRRRQKQWRLIP
jgi:hypothetical protein